MLVSGQSKSVDINNVKADGETLEALFETLLGRSINNNDFKNENNNKETINHWIRLIVNSQEFKYKFSIKHNLKELSQEFIPDWIYRTPSLDPMAVPPKVICTGSCLMVPWKNVIQRQFPKTEVYLQTFNNGSELEDISETELQNVGFQIVQIPIRSILLEAEYLSLSLNQEGYDRIESVLKNCLMRLKTNLDAALKYNREMGLPVFLLNFVKPQANPLGLLMPKNDLFNFSHFVDVLNNELIELASKEKSVYIIDYDEISSTLGKRYIQDDLITHLNHGSFISWYRNEYDIELTSHGNYKDYYRPKIDDAIIAIFNECLAGYNIISPFNKIKIVVFDLDGTLWRGVPADTGDISPLLTEGWPLSILEAASYLKKRGILLAIASKNDPQIATDIWNRLYGKAFPLSNFVSTKFTWESKIQSIGEILQETNLLPGNCLFVDDNPIEIEKVKHAYPDIKTIAGPISTWRRTLLWGVELQVPYVTQESINRSESIKGMMARETIKQSLNETDYIKELNIKVELGVIKTTSDPNFKRAFELLNKTNQFNTTGVRWTDAEMADYLSTGGQITIATVSDRLSDYGIAAVLLSKNTECTQIVMSCRVFSLNVEFALFDSFVKGKESSLSLLFKDTGKNPLCRNFLKKIDIAISDEKITEQSLAIEIPKKFRLPADLISNITVA